MHVCLPATPTFSHALVNNFLFFPPGSPRGHRHSYMEICTLVLWWLLLNQLKSLIQNLHSMDQWVLTWVHSWETSSWLSMLRTDLFINPIIQKYVWLRWNERENYRNAPWLIRKRETKLGGELTLLSIVLSPSSFLLIGFIYC